MLVKGRNGRGLSRVFAVKQGSFGLSLILEIRWETPPPPAPHTFTFTGIFRGPSSSYFRETQRAFWQEKAIRKAASLLNLETALSQGNGAAGLGGEALLGERAREVEEGTGLP